MKGLSIMRSLRLTAPRPALAVAVVTLLATAPALLLAGTASAAGYNLYFGDLHSHTHYSDGQATPAIAYAAAREGGADFFATTDHVHYPYGTDVLTPSLWAETRAAADAATKDGVFVAIAGYELWLPYAGELNIYNTSEIFGQAGNPGDHGYNNGNHESTRTVLPSLYDWLATTGAVAQWNHPLVFGGSDAPLTWFYHFDWWSAVHDQGIVMCESYNGGSYEAAYIEALDKGWHVLPSANSDTHRADWISGYEERTVLLADGLTRAKLFEAMRASRGYATRDKDLAIRYSLNGAVMGSTLAPKASYKASIQISDPDGARDAVKLVEIVADGGAVVAQKAFDGPTVSWSPTVSSSTARYFRVRVTTAKTAGDGPTAWTAPVWTGR